MVSSSPAVGRLKGMAQRAAHYISVYIGYLQTRPHTGWMLVENDAQTIFFNQGAWSCVGANGQPGSTAIGNTLMLLMKPPPAQGGFPKFSTSGPLLKSATGLPSRRGR